LSHDIDPEKTMVTSTSTPNKVLPLVVEAANCATGDGDLLAGTAGLLDWYEDYRTSIEDCLLTTGAVLFRGFEIETPSSFKRVTKALSTELIESVEENVPRTRLTSGVYTSTEYPPEYYLSLHSEYAYSNNWPARLFFCCIVAPQAGGETPLADNRTILAALDRDLVAEFKRKKITYLRNLHCGEGFGLSWQKAFQTTERSVVEHYCRNKQVELKWTSAGALQLAQTMEATMVHPTTGEEVWFNQAPQFHPSDYPSDIAAALIGAYANVDELPQYVRFGDGSEIHPTALDHIRTVMKQQAVTFPWIQGDLLLLDNVLISHGRKPFSGPRKILVAMAAG
jgi:alpha-ketoglutarate-dependent taurine dioxygenase